MKMSNFSGKLKEIDIVINENLLVHLILISRPAQFTHLRKFIILIKINGVLMSLSLNVCKKKIGLRERGQKCSFGN